MTLEVLSILPLGFALGIVHALDADHVMAVSSLSARTPGARRPWSVSLMWSLGHSGLLLAVACVVVPLGLVIPPAFSRVAEGVVGLGMIGLGIWVLAGMIRRRGHIHFHRHSGLPSHAHWHVHHADSHHPAASGHAHVHAPVMMGALHGLAGSAPIFALLPAVGEGSIGLAIAYVMLFGLGVLLAMLLFGGLLGQVMTRWAGRFGRTGVQALQTAAASGSMLVGVMLLHQSL